MKISIVICEPLADSPNSVGAYEWRVDPEDAEREFRSLRGTGTVTRLWHGIDIDAPTPDAVTECIDAVYWSYTPGPPLQVWGPPDREYTGPV